jgi:hypothetical protein
MRHAWGKLPVEQLIAGWLAFMEPGGLSPWSQNTVDETFREPFQSSTPFLALLP